MFLALYPPSLPTQQARIASDLIELRNKSVFAFLMFNALFVLIVFLLQLNKDQLHVVWPLGVKTNITYVEETSEVSDDQASRQGKKGHGDVRYTCTWCIVETKIVLDALARSRACKMLETLFRSEVKSFVLFQTVSSRQVSIVTRVSERGMDRISWILIEVSIRLMKTIKMQS